MEEKRPLLDRAGNETDGSNLRRRQVQGKVYIRRGEPCTCSQLQARSQGRRWEAQERGEMMQEGRGAGGTGLTADAEGLLRGPAETCLFPWEGEDCEDRQGGAQAEGAAERSAGREALSACAVCVPFLPTQPPGGTASDQLHCVIEQEWGDPWLSDYRPDLQPDSLACIHS